MLENYFRPQYQKFLVNFFAKWCSQYITPNKVTLLSCLFGISILPSILFHQNWLAIIFLLLSGYLDTLDGTIARLQHKTSNIGTALDILSDRLVEAVIIISLFLVDPTHRGLLALCMLSSVLVCVTSFLIVGIFTPNDSQKSFHYSPGLMERAEAFIFFGGMILFPSMFVEFAILFSILVMLTAGIRLYQFAFSTVKASALPSARNNS